MTAALVLSPNPSPSANPAPQATMFCNQSETHGGNKLCRVIQESLSLSL